MPRAQETLVTPLLLFNIWNEIPATWNVKNKIPIPCCRFPISNLLASSNQIIARGLISISIINTCFSNTNPVQTIYCICKYIFDAMRCVILEIEIHTFDHQMENTCNQLAWAPHNFHKRFSLIWNHHTDFLHSNYFNLFPQEEKRRNYKITKIFK